jgi:DNA-binding transcriptional MerR regulator
MVRRALRIGFTLAELARIFRTREKGGIPCRDVRSLAERKLKDLDAQLAEMSMLRDHLARLLSDWDRRLAATPAGARALLLEALGDPPCGKVKRL